MAIIVEQEALKIIRIKEFSFKFKRQILKNLWFYVFWIILGHRKLTNFLIEFRFRNHERIYEK